MHIPDAVQHDITYVLSIKEMGLVTQAGAAAREAELVFCMLRLWSCGDAEWVSTGQAQPLVPL